MVDLKAYDEQTQRLRALGKRCLICGERADRHEQTTWNTEASVAHAWTDDEMEAAVYERDHSL